MHAPKELHNKWREKLPQFEAVVGKYQIEKKRMAAEVQNPIAAFAAMMEHLDNQVGALLTMLDELGIADNTIIMFASDNGPHFAGGHDPVFWNSNGNLRGFKRDLYEGGIRSPLLVRWPTKIQPGTSSDHISAFWDMMPTFAEIINQPIPEQSDGISMLNALTNKDADQQDHPYLYWKFVTPSLKLSGHAVRMGDWKIIQTLAQAKKAKVRSTGLVELYNLADDESETKDLAEIHPELTEKMTKILYSKKQ
jgi:arylsulfatase A-like enzyme